MGRENSRTGSSGRPLLRSPGRAKKALFEDKTRRQWKRSSHKSAQTAAPNERIVATAPLRFSQSWIEKAKWGGLERDFTCCQPVGKKGETQRFGSCWHSATICWVEIGFHGLARREKCVGVKVRLKRLSSSNCRAGLRRFEEEKFRFATKFGFNTENLE